MEEKSVQVRQQCVPLRECFAGSPHHPLSQCYWVLILGRLEEIIKVKQEGEKLYIILFPIISPLAKPKKQYGNCMDLETRYDQLNSKVQ